VYTDFPQIDAHVADPIRMSIEWVNEKLSPKINGYASPINPPLSYPDKKFDLIFAISIWSHYNFGPGETINGSNEGSGLRWLHEMRRIIKSDGHLVITTHGWVGSYSKVGNLKQHEGAKLISCPHPLTFFTPLLLLLQVTDFATATKIRNAFDSGVGEFYVAAFPGNVDWDPDTSNPDWGMSWVDPAWLARKLKGEWEIKVLSNGRNDCLQDNLVLVPV
jgi:hypothetical protein